MASSSSRKYALLDRLAEEFAARFRAGERPSIQEYIDRHPELADEIRELFPALAEVERAEAAKGPPAGPPALEQLGDFRIIREVGRGGMGVVFEAEQLSLGRRVALKILPAGSLMEPREVERFEREARAAAQLHHTNIVPVYGVGHEGGLRYYVMQFIPGQPLDAVLGELRHLRLGSTAAHHPAASAVAQSLLSAGGVASAPRETSALGALPRSRSPGSGLSGSGQPYWRGVARIGAQVADALAHAHGQGTLHRDVKPSNLLLDANGIVWVTDFGLAKATGSSNLTGTGEVVGTLRFIPPERFGGHSDARGDVYSLGLTLYEMLTLRPAFDVEDRLRLIEQILNSEPPPPRKLNAEVPRDLETVVLKAMARDPAHRYQSAAEFAADLRRFAEDRPVLARRIGPVERAARWCRKSPALASLMAAVALLLLLGGVGGSIAALHFRHTAIQEATLRKNAQDAAAANQKLIGEQYVAQGARLLDQGDVSGALVWFVEALARDQDDEGRAAQHRVRIGATLRQCPKPTHVHFHPGKVTAAAFSPDGGRVVTCCEDGSARVWDAATGAMIGEPPRHDGPVTAARFSPDGKRLMTQVRTGGRAGPGLQPSPVTYSFWGPDSGEPVRVHSPLSSLDSLVSRDLRFALTVQDDTTVQVIDTTTGRPAGPAIRERELLHEASLSADGSRVVTVTGSIQGDPKAIAVHLWKAADGTEVPLANPPRILHGDSSRAQGIAEVTGRFTPDGRSLLATLPDGVHAWDAATGAERFVLPAPANGSLFAYQPAEDTPLLLKYHGFGVSKGWVKAIDAADGHSLSPEVEDGGNTRVPTVTPDGGRLLCQGTDNSLKVWDADTGQVQAVLRLSAASSEWAVSPDGLYVAVVTIDHGVRVWKPDSGQPATALMKHDRPVESVAFSPDGRQLLTVCGDVVRLWPTVVPPAESVRLAPDSTVLNSALSADGSRAVTVSARVGRPGPAEVELWDAQTGRRLAGPVPGDSAQLSRDGRRVAIIATGAAGPEAWFWAPDVGLLKRLGPAENAMSIPAFCVDDRRVLVVATTFNPAGRPPQHDTVRLWEWDEARSDLIGYETIPVESPHLQMSGPISFPMLVPPDGRSYLDLREKDDRTDGRMIDLRTGKVVCQLAEPAGQAVRPGHGAPPLIAFSADGRRVFVLVSGRGAVWDVASGKLVSQLPGAWMTDPASPGAATSVFSASFSPDGRRLLLVAVEASDSRAQVWDVDGGRFLDQPLTEEWGTSQAGYSSDGQRVVTVDRGGGVRIWEAATGEPLTAVIPNDGPLTAKFLGDSRTVVTTRHNTVSLAPEAEIRFWDAATAQPLSPCCFLSGQAAQLQAQPLGGSVGSAGVRMLLSDVRGVMVVDLTPETRPLEELRTAAEVLAVRRVNDFGRLQKLEHDRFVAGWRQLQGEGSGTWNRGIPAGLDWNRRMAVMSGASNFAGFDGLTMGRQIGGVNMGFGGGQLGMFGQLGAGGGYAVPNPLAGHFATAWHSDRLIAAEPDRPEHYRLRGKARAGQRRWKEALDDLTRAIDGREPGLWSDRGHVNARLGRWKEAVEDFERALREPMPASEVNNARTALTLARLGMDDRAGYRKDCEAILKEAAEAIARPEPYFFDWPLCTLTSDALSDFPKFLDYAEKHRQLFGPGGEIGPIYYRCGKLAEARKVLENQVSTNPSLRSECFFLAMAQYGLNDKDKTRASLDLGIRRSDERKKKSGGIADPSQGLSGWQLDLIEGTLRGEAQALIGPKK